MEKLRISAIVPMYNASETIEECLDSIVGQSIFDKMEVLIVDDASTDNSIEIAARYEQRYSDNIILICLDENAGPGNARNVAMEYASGEYVGFVDADDAIVPAMYEHLLEEALRTGADVVDGGFYDQGNNEAIIYTSDNLIGKLDGHKRSDLIASGGYNVTKIFNKRFLRENNIYFRNAYVLEDMDYLIEVFAKAKNIANVKEIMYIYRNKTDSLSKTMETEKYILSTTEAMKAIYEKTSCLQSYDEIKDACEYAIIQLYSYSLNKALTAYFNKEKDKQWLIEMMDKLGNMKKAYVIGAYDNKYIKNKISESDIGIMKINDAYDFVEKNTAINQIINPQKIILG